MASSFSLQGLLLLVFLSCTAFANDATWAPSFPRYSRDVGHRCGAGSSVKLGESQDEAKKCADLCSKDMTCAGFNYRYVDLVCVMRTDGCELSEDADAAYYKKLSVAVGPTMPSVVEESNLTPGFQTNANQRCTGGSSVQVGEIMTAYDPTKCIEKCAVDTNCAGLNWRPNDLICVLRTAGCVVVDDEGAIYYKKVSARVPTQPVAVEKAIEKTKPSKEQNKKANSAASVEPTPQTTDTITPIPTELYWEETIVASASVEPAIEDFTTVTDTRCSSGSMIIGDLIYATGPQACADICRANPDCVGVNWHYLWSVCECRKSGCVETKDVTIVYYRKTKGNAQLFDIKPETKCVGGTSLLLGASANGFKDCSTMCQNDVSCAGFNYVSSIELCGLRSTGCVETMNNAQGITYYKKVAKSTKQGRADDEDW